MGNSQTKEARGHAAPSNRHSNSGGGGSSGGTLLTQESHDPPSGTPRESYQRRPSRHEFSLFGIGGSVDQDTASLEARRESKAEREARRAEKERQSRLKERERSMREEHVDGGYLVTQGVYVGPEDYNKSIVRQLMVERRLAPFWRGLNDFSESWAEHQLMAAARGMPIPPADHVPPELEYMPTKQQPLDANKDTALKGMMVPIGSRSQSFQSDQAPFLNIPNGSLPSPPLPGSGTSPTAPLFRARAKTLASLASSRQNGSADAAPREFQLPPDPFVNGQPVEVYLYKDASECPICFLYYPPYLNTTRCCEQPICSECFVQIKRPDPHPPEHEQPDPNAPPVSEEERQAQAEGLLVSEIAACPYCKQPEFGITYTAPSFRRGLTFGTGSQPYQAMSPTSSQVSLSSGQMSPTPGSRRRGTSLSANAPEVITTDKVRPDWFSKLQTARAHAARRSAAATALHTAAYMLGPNERSGFPGFGRRGMRRQPSESDASSEAQRNALAYLAERQSQVQGGSMLLPPPRGSSSRRNRIDDIEELMMIEAIRLSLASEEERRRKEEKDAKKKAKKEEKESRKAEKAARKNSLLSGAPFVPGETSASMERSMSNTSSVSPEDTTAKGKGVDRALDATDEDMSNRPTGLSSFQSTSQESLASGLAIPPAPEPFRRSHLRQMSNASSASSSFAEAGISYSGTGTPPTAAPAEPLFNFRSLTAMISEDEKADGRAHIEHQDNAIDRQPSLENLDEAPSPVMGRFSMDEREDAPTGPGQTSKRPDIAIQSANAQVEGQSHS